MKKKNENLKWYTISEFSGRVCVLATKVVVISYVIGTLATIIWDTKERRANKAHK
jgi:hypothetical protein